MKRFLGLLCALLCLAPKCSAAPPLLIILLPGTSLTDWTRADAPALHQLMQTGAIAVMNTRTARLAPGSHDRETPESACLTLGCGARAAADYLATRFKSPNSVSIALYRRYMGTQPPSGEWINPDWPETLRANAGLPYEIRLGNLGDALLAHHISLLAGGGPFSSLLAARSNGSLTHLPRFALPPASCVIWDAGTDLHSADKTLSEAVLLVTAARGRLLLISPFVSDALYAQGHRLTPVLLWGHGVNAGTLYSTSTHRSGLVSNTDLAATVASYFGAELPSPTFIHPWTIRARSNAGPYVATLEAHAYAQALGMRVLPAMAVLLGLYLGGATLYWRKVRPAPALALFPMAWVASALLTASAPGFIFTLTLGTAALLGLSRWIAPARLTLGLACLTLFALLADMLCGDPLMTRSLLGYSFVEGARYYGVGNESMGVLIGASLIVAAQIGNKGSRVGRLWAGLLLTVTAALLVSPLAGAKAGGVLVAVPSFWVLLWRQSRRRITAKAVALFVTGAVLTMVAIAAFDLHHSGQTHVALAVQSMAHGGYLPIAEIVSRKLAVELHLLYHSAWAVPVWIGLAALLFVKVKGSQTSGNNPIFASGVTAMVTILLFNDAGAVAAALCVALLWSASIAADMEKPLLRGEPQSRGQVI